MATWDENLPLVRYLHGMGVDISTSEDLSLIIACERGHLELVKYLHLAGANIENVRGYLSDICIYGNLHIIKYLQNAGLEHMFDRFCVCVLLKIMDEGHNELLEYLREQGYYLEPSKPSALPGDKYCHRRGGNYSKK